jgi:acyl-CoA dehydrogenase
MSASSDSAKFNWQDPFLMNELLSEEERLVRDTARQWLTGEDRRIAPSVAKLFCTEMAGKVADLAIQIHGGTGYMRGVPVERIYRDVRLLRLYEGTSEIQRLIIGGGLVKAARA